MKTKTPMRLVAPGGKAIGGLLETMRVYVENPHVVRTEEGETVVSRDYQKEKLKSHAAMRLYIDCDGAYWFENDLIPETSS